ncbi:hypothetical protein COB52_05515, partial [Candidatus Kaiserbacteria bacterium]
MIEKIAGYFVDRSFLVNLISGFVCIAGLLVFFNMKRDLVPPFEYQKIDIEISAPGASPEEVEEFIAFPIEETLKGLPGVEKMTSNSRNGSLALTLYFKASFDRMSEMVEHVKSQIDSLRPRLPEAVRYTNVKRSRRDQVFFTWLAFQNFDEENVEHRKHIRRFSKTMGKIDGIVLVDPEIRPRDLYIEFDAAKLEKYDVSLDQARSFLAQVFQMKPIGQLSKDESTLNFEIKKIQRTPKGLEKLPLAGNRIGSVVTLGDVAQVSYKLTAKANIFHYNGDESVGVLLLKDRSSDSIDLKEIFEKKLVVFNKTLPEPLSVGAVSDGPQFIIKQLDVLRNNAMFGIAFVFLLLIIFLNWRSAIMTLAGLPIAYLGTMLILSYLGIDIDLISIIGLILVLGILVDDAIIVSERYVENLSSGMTPRDSAIQSVRALIVPVTGTVLTTIVAFLPILIIKSEMAIVLRAIPIVIIAALLFSWIESFFILPNHLAHFAKKARQSRIESSFAKIQRGYRRLLASTLRFRYLALIVIGGVFALSIYIAKEKLKHDFKLRVSSQRVAIYPILKKSESLDFTYEKIKALEEFALSLPKSQVSVVTTWVGEIWKDGRRYHGNRFAKINLYIPESASSPSKVKKQLVQLLTERLKTFKTDEFQEVTIVEQRQGDKEEKKDLVSIRVQGDESSEFEQIESEIEKAALKTMGISKYVKDPDAYQETWRFQPNTHALVQYKIDLKSFRRQLKHLF